MKFREFLSEACPLRQHPYGKIKTCGGYRHYTEYEIGAGRMAEAAHCVLGSLVRSVGADGEVDLTQGELAHIDEELGIIKRVQREYSQELYKPGRVWSGSKYKDESAASIEKTSRELLKTVPALRKSVSRGYPREFRDAADAAYNLIYVLAKEMIASLGDEDKNAFGSSQLARTVNDLEHAAKKLKGVAR
jgi:hypothetical protein